MHSVLRCPLIVIVNRQHSLLPYMPVLVNVFDLWSIGECCCQGYSAVLAQGAFDDD